MTGQEWYERLIRELEGVNLAAQTADEERLLQLAEHTFLKAAERAANIDDIVK